MANKEPMTDELIKNIVDEVVDMTAEIVGLVWGTEAYHRQWTDKEMSYFNTKTTELRDETVEKLTQSLQKYGEKVGIDIYTKAIELTRKQKQTVGEKNDYYITLEQLEIILTKSRKNCLNCGQQIDRPIENAEEKLKMATSFETGKGIYYAILGHKFRSIDLCNWCYSIMQTYRQSISKEEREYKEKKGASNSSQS